jgi:hypothetical protein
MRRRRNIDENKDQREKRERGIKKEQKRLKINRKEGKKEWRERNTRKIHRKGENEDR